MSTLTFEEAIPLFGEFGIKDTVSQTVAPKTNKRFSESTEDACIHMRKYFPDFHFLPRQYVNHFESIQITDASQVDSKNQVQTNLLKKFLQSKVIHYRKLEGFNENEFFKCSNITEMTDYLTDKFRNSITKRKQVGIKEYKDLIEVIESHFLSHIAWHIEKGMNEFGDKVVLYYRDAINNDKKRCTDAKRVYLRDTIAGLTEYKFNLQKNFLYSLRKKIYSEDVIRGETPEINLREIYTRPGANLEQNTTGIVGRVKSLFARIF